MKYFYLNCSILLLSVCFFSKPAQAQPVLSYESRITGLTQPVDIVNAADGSGRIFVVQQGGVIRVYGPALTLLGDFLTVTGISTGGEQGLLSMVFHPNYENPDPAIGGFFFVYYTNAAGDLELARYHVSANPNIADPATKTVVLTIPHPVNTNHNGGKLIFGSDGYLYFGTGDGGSGGDPPNNAQNGSVLLGKMLRIAVTTSVAPPFYTIPPGNPFISNPAIADEIWALGLRNPWRWSFDRLTGDMWIADVGQGAREEVNFIAATNPGGLNFGWRCFEGTLAYNTTGCLPYSSYFPPIFDYPHNSTTGGFSITGGYVYRGPDYPSLTGYYIAADFVSGNQWKIRQTGPSTFNITMQSAAGLPTGIAGFGEAEDGTLYAASRSAGVIYKVAVAGVLPVTLIDFSARAGNNLTTLQWKTAGEDNLLQFILEYSNDGINYQQLTVVPASGMSGGSTYSFDHSVSDQKNAFYRLKMVDRDLRSQYSSIILVKGKQTSNHFIFPTIINDNLLTAYINRPYETLQLVQMNGTVVLNQNIRGQMGKIEIPVHRLTPGTYIVIVRGGTDVMRQKIIIQ